MPYAYAQQEDTADEVASGETAADTQESETSTEEWEMDLSLPTAVTPSPNVQSDVSLPNAAKDKALQQMLSKLAADPTDTEVLTQLNVLLADALKDAGKAMDRGNTDEAEQILAVILPIDPSLPGFRAAQQRLKRVREINGLLDKGNTALEAHRVIEPENDNALYYFNQALSKDTNNDAAESGLAKVQEALIERAYEAAQELDFGMAAQWLQRASDIYEDQSQVADASEQLDLFKEMHAADLEARILAAITSRSFNAAHSGINELIALGAQEERINVLRKKLGDARFYAGFKPGQLITDDFLRSADKAPEIVVIAAGSFMMGSTSNSRGASNNEQPRHKVTVEHGFGLGVMEVTVEQFRLFIQSTGYLTTADRSGSSLVYDEAAGKIIRRDGMNWQYDYLGETADPGNPVIHVSFDDAVAYVRWLAAETGKRYRLPSEAEHEYVARASGRSNYWWGEGSPAKVVENLTGQGDESPSQRNWGTPFKKYKDGYWGPAPAGSLRDSSLVHPMGVYDIAGNVKEWVEDCWHLDYSGAPIDGTAWVDAGCTRRVARGGYWASEPVKTRAAYRIAAKPETTGPVIGIRIARDL